MDINSLKDQKEKSSLPVEVANVEKKLCQLVCSKGLLHTDVQDLYRKACFIYKKVILDNRELAELQDIEESLWMLHYRYIKEFRIIKQKSSTNEETTEVVEGFKSFLSEAIEFYKRLIVKIRRCYGLPEDFSFYRTGGNLASLEPKKMQKLQFLCHRFQLFLGDLTRYREEISDVQNHNWSVSFSHYMEATMIWPDSGKPQNQLFVLALYVGDEFLALYHCIRSLAVKEPFPDAWKNLDYLFESNRSSLLRCLSSEAEFNFLKPSESGFQVKSQSTNDLSISKETNVWPLIIRVISFFLIKPSLDDFPCTFASTMKELDVLLALDDSKLKMAMESYQLMDSSRDGPFRPLQLVSIFIYVMEHLINSPAVKDGNNSNDAEQLALTQLALTNTFIFMGRLVDRCLKANSLDSCPLLPAVLVFMEWLVGILDKAETYASDDKSISAISYFFAALLELLNKLDMNRGVKLSGSIALWEDYELRGFAPLACSHRFLDFSNHCGQAYSFGSGAECRVQRIIGAAMKIAETSTKNWRRICWDRSKRKFYVAEPTKSSDRKVSDMAESPTAAVEVKEPKNHLNKDVKECEEPSGTDVCGKSFTVEEEEVILFKPLTRYNSAPLYSSGMSNDQISPKDTGDQILPADECLRRATSLLIAQNQAHADPLGFHSDLTNFRRNKPQKQQDVLVKDTTMHQFSEASTSLESPSFSSSIATGPPSLNAWVLNRVSLSNDRAKGKSEVDKHTLAPIEEIASASLNDLSISETEEPSFISGHQSMTSHYPSPDYSSSVPSAPFLPDDAVWCDSTQSTFSNHSNPGTNNRTNSFLDMPQLNCYSNFPGYHQLLDCSPGISGFVDGNTPSRPLTSSEWLRQYRESHNLQLWPVHSYVAENPGNFYGYEMSGSGLFDQWGTPLAPNPLVYDKCLPLHPALSPVYATDEHRREKLFHSYQRPSPYVCGTVYEPEPLLHYLKEKEWLLQQDPSLRGPTFT